MISVAVQMQFDLFEVSKINNLNSKDFINFLLSKNKKVVRITEGSNGLPVFKINAENIILMAIKSPKIVNFEEIMMLDFVQEIK